MELINDLCMPVMESFYTIQGEGFHQGKAAYFIRLAGCDVGCVWCDVKESWDSGQHPRLSIQELADSAKAHPTDIAVVTGGEPLMQNCSMLTVELRKAGLHTHLETSGAYPISGTWDWICLSPKKFKPPLPEILPLANELKVVIFHKTDLAWAEQYANLVSPSCQLYLQPEWSKSNLVTPLLVDYIKNHPRWRVSLQIHKYLQVP